LVIPILYLVCFTQGIDGKCGSVQKRGVDEKGKKTALKMGNQIRQNECRAHGAQGMMLLKWDDALAKEAQELANTCEMSHDDNSDRDTKEHKKSWTEYLSNDTFGK